MDIEKLSKRELENYLSFLPIGNHRGDLRHVEKAGEGNMNVVLRACFDAKNLIVKQAKPYVQKYPSIAAPVERAAIEAQFYAHAEDIDALGEWLPKIHHFDAAEHVLVMEDLGAGRDFLWWYAEDNSVEWAVVGQLVAFLKNLHGVTDQAPLINRDMRELNHAHMFDLPFRKNNGFDLDGMYPGLRALAEELIFGNGELVNAVTRYGEEYLNAKSGALLHGDYYPGSWLSTDSGLKVIDPEFAFTGPREFDLGIFAAHLRFAGANQEEVNEAFAAYGEFDRAKAEAFESIEILRRLFGIAQLPLPFDIHKRRALASQTIQKLTA